MEKIFSKVAAKNSTTVAEVKSEICAAINMAMENSDNNPEAKEFWSNISKDGKSPSPEEVIKAIVARLQLENR